MKTNALTGLSFAFATATLGGCVDVESGPQDTAKAKMAPWEGTPGSEIAEVLSQHPGSVQINEDQIAWNNGDVILTIPSSTQPQAQSITAIDTDISIESASDCPPGWFCLWQDINFTNRRVQFQGSGCQNLTNFGFNDLASSWFNRHSADYRVYRHIGCSTLLFVARSGVAIPDVGSVDNDQASSICRGACP